MINLHHSIYNTIHAVISITECKPNLILIGTSFFDELKINIKKKKKLVALL
jgi:hypothetical protein